MTVLVVDADAVIRHGRRFPEKARRAARQGRRIVIPEAVKRELVDDVLDADDPPPNHRESAEEIQELIDESVLEVHEPDPERYSKVIDEARRRISGDSLPEHEVKADRYVPATVCELAEENRVKLVSGDRKLSRTVREIASSQGVGEEVSVHEPLSLM